MLTHLSSMNPILLVLELDQYKSEPCSSLCNSKTCPYFHSYKEQRRKYRNSRYSKDLCGAKGCSDEPCVHARNAIEVRYHPENYKKKYCQEQVKGVCGFAEFCSGVHSDLEAKFRPLHLLPIDRNFLFFYFKSEFCPYSWYSHNAFLCVYAHNWQDYKRPFFATLQPLSCPHWSKDAKITEYLQGCPQGFSCSYCHGWKELEYHPSVFKKVSCKKCVGAKPSPDENPEISRQICCFKHPDENPDLGFNKKLFTVQRRAEDHGRHSTGEYFAFVGLQGLAPPGGPLPTNVKTADFLTISTGKSSLTAQSWGPYSPWGESDRSLKKGRPESDKNLTDISRNLAKNLMAMQVSSDKDGLKKAVHFDAYNTSALIRGSNLIRNSGKDEGPKSETNLFFPSFHNEKLKEEGNKPERPRGLIFKDLPKQGHHFNKDFDFEPFNEFE